MSSWPSSRGSGVSASSAAWRGWGEKEGLRRGCTIFMATVDPRNTPSLRNFIFEGYDIVCVKESYYIEGVPRAVLMKRADGKKMAFPSLTDGMVLEAVPHPDRVADPAASDC